jgi:hypothetical protein
VSDQPPQQRCRRHDRDHLGQKLASESFGFGGQPTPLVIREPQPSFTQFSRRTRFSSRKYSIICSWCRFIHPAAAISTNRNGSTTFGIGLLHYPGPADRAAMYVQEDLVSGPYAIGARSHNC